MSFAKHVLVFGLSAGLVACPAKKDDAPPTGSCTSTACEQSLECAVGEFCQDFCCVPFTGCTPTSCSTGQFCDTETLDCTAVTEKCELSAEGCECHIANTAGQLEATAATPKIVLAPGANLDVSVLVAVVDGQPLPGAAFTLSLTDDDDFSVSGTTLTAKTGSGGSTTLTATVTGLAGVTCFASIENLGDSSGVRAFVFDDANGTPVSGAQVIIDTDADGDDDGSAGSTDVNGLATADGVTGGTFTITVFASGYNYLSIVGLAAPADLAIPVSKRSATVGGFDGKVDFDKYEQLFTSGLTKELTLAYVLPSLPLSAVSNFNGAMFFPSAGDDTECTSDNQPGCYAFNFAGQSVLTKLPGGLVASLAGAPIKTNFEVSGPPGRRFAWTLTGEVDFADHTDLLALLTPLLTSSGDKCTCNTVDNVCDVPDPADCACDAACLQFGEVFDAVRPLFASFASGASGNLGLPSVTLDTWEDYISEDYETRYATGNPAAANFPRLDDGSRGKLSPVQALSVFTDFTAPALPMDTTTNHTLEGMIVLTGVIAKGQGFVPLGFSAAVDCTVGNCLDRTANSAGFNGVVNGGVICKEGLCPAGASPSVADGHIGLLHAPAHSGLEVGEWLTIVVSAPVSDLLAEDALMRATGFIKRAEPQTGASTQISSSSFPAIPTLASSAKNRSYTPITGSGHELHWVTFATDKDDLTNSPADTTTRWNVYIEGSEKFTAPAVPSDWGDPAAARVTAGTEIPAGFVNITHLGLDLEAGAPSLQELASNDGTTLGDVGYYMDGFAVINGDVNATP